MAPAPRPGWDPLKYPTALARAPRCYWPILTTTLWSHSLTVRGSELASTVQFLAAGGASTTRNHRAAALREATEEIGVDPSDDRTARPPDAAAHPGQRVSAASDCRLHLDAPAFSAPNGGGPIIKRPSRCWPIRPWSSAKFRTRVVNGQSIDVAVPYFDIDERKSGGDRQVLAEFCAISARERPRVRPRRCVALDDGPSTKAGGAAVDLFPSCRGDAARCREMAPSFESFDSITLQAPSAGPTYLDEKRGEYSLRCENPSPVRTSNNVVSCRLTTTPPKWQLRVQLHVGVGPRRRTARRRAASSRRPESAAARPNRIEGEKQIYLQPSA